MYYDIGAYDMLYSEFKEMVRKAWCEKFNHLCIDLTKKNEGNYCIFNGSETTYNDCICESEAFYKHMTLTSKILKKVFLDLLI